MSRQEHIDALLARHWQSLRDLLGDGLLDVPGKQQPSSVGASVMATGIVQTAWVLHYVHDCVPLANVYLAWEPFAEARDGLMLWEAFVTRGAKGASDEEDATIGLDAFCAQLPTPGDADANETQRPLSLAAAAAMWAGWDLQPDALRAACVLVRA